MDAETNKCLAALANPTPPEPKSLRSEILRNGSHERRKFTSAIIDGWRNREPGSLTVADCVSYVQRSRPEWSELTPEDLQVFAAAAQDYFDREDASEQQRLGAERSKAAAVLHRIAGRRLSTATLENYVVARPEQAAILAAIRDYVANIDMRMLDGVGIVMNGPSGNGKDHLLISAARAAIHAGYTVCWKNGQDLLGEFRDRIGTDESEESLLAPLLSADVLVISDPLPPSGSLTDYQASMVYRVLDARYRDCKATWASMNVTSRKEADNRIGVAIVDRLRHGALCLACNWPSYRKPFESGK